jgi:uncharacterized protein YidB (DUF937 family)
VPNPTEQGAVDLGQRLRAAGKSDRQIADAWVSELGLSRIDAKSIQRILDRVDAPDIALIA